MSKFISLVVLFSLSSASLLTAPAAAQSAPVTSYQSTSYQAPYYQAPPLEPRPRSGVGGVIVGAAGMAIGAGALLLMPICFASFYPGDSYGCAIGQGINAGLAFTAGIIGLSIGIPRRARYKEWKARQRAQATYGDLDLSTVPGGAGLRYRLAF